MTKPSVFQLIDLDRTLFDTSKFVKAITDEINITNPGLGTELDERFEAAYKNEETFFLLRHLRKEKGDLWLETLVASVVARYGSDAFLLSGVKERLAFAETLSSHAPAWGILTYGDTIDQTMKLRILGMSNVPVYLTQTPDKGEVLQAWKTLDGRFQLPAEYGGGVVDIITLEDDKLRAFNNLPEQAVGLWVAAPGKENHGEGVETASNVFVVQNLFESIDHLKAHFA